MVSETKSWFFEKIDKVDKPFTGLVMKKKKKKGSRQAQINKIRSEKRRSYNRHHRHTEEYKRAYQQLYVSKMDNIGGDKFLEGAISQD